MDLTVKGVIADPSEYSLECRLFPRTNWDANPLADTTNWYNGDLCETDVNYATNVVSCACKGTGYVAIFQSKNKSSESHEYFSFAHPLYI